MAEFELHGVKLSVPDAMLNEKLTTKLASGGYEAHEALAASKRVRAGNRVLELGSGLGYIASICAGLTDPEKVVTVEANPDMLPVIRGNLDRNGFGAVTLIHGAVTDLEDAGDVIEFEIRKSFWAGRLAVMDSDPATVVQVPLLTLRSLLRAHRPHVVIMDIEGAEAHLFDAPWPAHVKTVLMELHPGQYPDTVIKKIVDCMSASGLTYDPFASQKRILGFRRIRRE